MFNAEEEFAKLNFKDAKITVPRMSIGGSNTWVLIEPDIEDDNFGRFVN